PPHPGPVVWGSAEYLFWWLSDAPMPLPLVISGGPAAGIGVQPGLGDVGRIDGFSGGRLRLGLWLDAERTWGAEVGGFLLEQKSRIEAVGEDNSPLERLAINAVTGQTFVVP